MTPGIRFIFCGGSVSLLTILIALFVFYPEKTSQSKQSLEAVGAVAVDNVISAMEERVGKTAVVMEHYKTAQKAKRESLISLKTLKADCERKSAECKAAAAALKAEGKDTAASIKESEQATYEAQSVSLAAKVQQAENAYKEFNLFLVNKKVELEALKAKTEMLKGELLAMDGGDAGFAVTRARQLEDEVKSTCARLEAEMQVMELEVTEH